MAYKKAWCLWGVGVAFLSLIDTNVSFGQLRLTSNFGQPDNQSANYSQEKTVQYVIRAATILQQTAEAINESQDPIKLLRKTAAGLRAIPRIGVDPEAVTLTLATAKLFDRTAELAKRKLALQQAAFQGGFEVGRMLGSEDQNEQAAGALIGILGLIFGANEVAQIEQETKAVEAAWQKIGSAWEAYLKKLDL